MVLGQVVGVKAQPVVSLDQLQPLGDLPDMRPSCVVVMVDDPEAHALNLTPRSFPTPGSLGKRFRTTSAPRG